MKEQDNKKNSDYFSLLTEDRTAAGDNSVKEGNHTFSIDSIRNQATFLAFGIALLLPWNAILAAMDYFIQIFPDYQPSFSFLLAVSLPMLGMQVVMFTLQRIIPLQVRLTFALFINAGVTLLIAVLPSIIDDQKILYYITLVLMIITGSGIASLQNSLYGTAGISMKLTNQLMLGVGISSVIINLLRMIFLASVSSYQTGAIVFFSLSSAYLFFCFILSIPFVRQYQRYQLTSSTMQNKEINVTESYHTSKLENLEFRKYKRESQTLWNNSWGVYKINYPFALMVALTYAIQYSFYPGVILKRKITFFNSFAWFSITAITFHNCLDTIGRMMVGKLIFINKKYFTLACCLRLIFVATYLLIYFGVADFFTSDAFMIVNLALFSISCGYLATLGMFYGSDKETGNQSLAGTIMAFHLTLGISVGSLIADVAFS